MKTISLLSKFRKFLSDMAHDIRVQRQRLRDGAADRIIEAFSLENSKWEILVLVHLCLTFERISY